MRKGKKVYYSHFDGVKIARDWSSQSLPPAVFEFLEKWQSIADEEMKTYEFLWPAKLVHTDFVYNGVKYRIFPETFGIPYDLCERMQQGPWVEERHGEGMDKDLKAIKGVTYVFSDGFLD